MTSYKIAYGRNPRDLEDSVDYLMRNGWTPTGGVSINTGQIGYFQSMVKWPSGPKKEVCYPWRGLK